jgi:hypothetical protein
MARAGAELTAEALHILLDLLEDPITPPEGVEYAPHRETSLLNCQEIGLGA